MQFFGFCHYTMGVAELISDTFGKSVRFLFELVAVEWA
jgi:hypothetical protein